MNNQSKILWDQIKSYNIGVSNAPFSFTERLARENGWSMNYALRAVFEYKRFMFIICDRQGSFTPSDQVDQVWHLHLLYTQDYWKRFCGSLLKKEIHHGPTLGGASERTKYTDLYLKTLSTYEEVFGSLPPADIWPTVEQRFKKINFVRVPKEEVYIVPRNLKKLLKWKN